MICIRLEGGLGNQMFQYAAGRALALRLGTELRLDVSTLLKNNRRVTARPFELGRFGHVGRMLDSREARWLPWLSRLHRLPAMTKWISRWRPFVEKDVAWQAAFDQLPDQTYLVGYWQTYRYCSGIEKILAREFEPIEELSLASQALANQMSAVQSVALHVRRGDYVSLAAAASFHGALPLSYYDAALRQVHEMVAEPHVFVFSDDPQWCRDNLQFRGAVTYVYHNVGPQAWQDLVLMGRCHHHIIANSSFSWWGAWLADQRWGVPGRLVIAPARWFAGQSDQHLQDRYPPHWVALC